MRGVWALVASLFVSFVLYAVFTHGGSLGDTGFVERSGCGPWNPFWASVYQVANEYIRWCYWFVVSMFVVTVLWEASDTNRPHPKKERTRGEKIVFAVGYASFFFLCGLGHGNEAHAMHHEPKYHWMAFLYLLEAAAATVGAYATWCLRVDLLRLV